MSAPKMLDDEVETDAELVRRLLESQHPQWARLPIAPVPSSGTVNAIYRLGDDLCVRLPRVERFAGDLEKEQVWLPKLASRLPIIIPESLAKGSPGEGYPFHWGVYRWLRGETWTTDHVTDLCQAAADLARFIAALQAIDAADGPRPYPGGCGAPLAEKDHCVRAAIEDLRDTVDADGLTTAWDAVRDAGEWSGPPLLVHGDLRPPNLLVAEGALSAVIDFGGLSAGDPACDLAPAWTLFSGESREVFSAAVSLDAATWMRGRGWALARVIDIAYYKTTNPEMVAEAQHTLEEVLNDPPRTD
jgi:aminoglycoside phosphotransferase (APT) family kinase protein